MINRRSFLSAAALTATTAALHPLPALAAAPTALSGLAKRAIPASGESIPVIGMGTSGSFEVDAAGRGPLQEVLRRFVAGGASVIDTSPNYGNAEDVLGDLMAELGVRDRIWLATSSPRTIVPPARRSSRSRSSACAPKRWSCWPCTTCATGRPSWPTHAN